MQSTQHYIDNERNFLASIVQEQPAEVIKFKTATLPVVEQVEIDVDIEKQITQLQESKMQQGIQKVVPVDFDTELGSFFSSISKEKEELKEKVKKEAKTISGLEDLFKDLSAVKKKKVVKKKKILLVEPEKKEEPIVEEVIEKTPQELTIIEKVSKQLSEMQVATELDKDKIKGLESIDSLDKLKTEFLNFKDIVARQMGTIGGGGLNPDKVDADLIPVKTATFNLGSADKTFKDLYLSGSSLVVGGITMDSGELTVLDSVTAGTVAASKAVVVDSNKDIGTFRNLTIDGVFTDGNYTFDTSGNVSGLGTIASGAITSSGVVTASGFTIGSAVISETELETIDGITAGTAIASKALIADSNIDITGLRNVTATGTVTAAGFTIGSAAITEAELEILDGASVSTTELNYLDITTLGTSQASKAVTVDSSGDLIVPDSDKYKFGAGSDMQLYHDGTNSYITNKTGALKIATETSGIALTIGHTTSQVTIADNLTVVGNLTVSGTETIVDTVTMQAQNAIIFEGATADAYETTLTIVDPTSADKTVYMPNATGYLPLLNAASTTVITATPAELNYVDGVTSAIQTQMDTKSTKAFAIAQAVALG